MDAQKTDNRRRATGEFDDSLLDPVRSLGRETRRATGWWWAYMLVGLSSIVLGAAALASHITVIGTLVAVFSLFLFYVGTFEIVLAATTDARPWLTGLTGAASIAAGIIALAWPGVTVVVLAVLVGASLIGWGIYRIYLSFADPLLRPRAVTLVEGIGLTALGVLALAWPNASVLVLAVLLGIFFIVFGVFSFVGSLHMLDLHHELKKAEGVRDESGKSGDGSRGLHRHAA
jgi:uncharacterized membrane protein HdeD (DUF308 family)